MITPQVGTPLEVNKLGKAKTSEAIIQFEAIVAKAQTLADGGIRITLDLPEDAIPQMAMLIEAKREGLPFEFVAKVKS